MSMPVCFVTQIPWIRHSCCRSSSRLLVKLKKRSSCDAADTKISFQRNSMRDSKDININKTKATSASKKWLKVTFPCANPMIWMHLSGAKVRVVSFRFCYPTQVIAGSDRTTSCIYRDIVRDLGPRPTAEDAINLAELHDG